MHGIQGTIGQHQNALPHVVEGQQKWHTVEVEGVQSAHINFRRRRTASRFASAKVILAINGRFLKSLRNAATKPPLVTPAGRPPRGVIEATMASASFIFVKSFPWMAALAMALNAITSGSLFLLKLLPRFEFMKPCANGCQLGAAIMTSLASLMFPERRAVVSMEALLLRFGI